MTSLEKKDIQEHFADTRFHFQAKSFYLLPDQAEQTGDDLAWVRKWGHELDDDPIFLFNRLSMCFGAIITEKGDNGETKYTVRIETQQCKYSDWEKGSLEEAQQFILDNLDLAVLDFCL